MFNLGGGGETKTTIHSVQKTANTTPYQSEQVLLATHREEGRQEVERKGGGEGRGEKKLRGGEKRGEERRVFS